MDPSRADGVEVLRDRLRQHLADLEAAGPRAPFLDLDLARDVHRRLDRVLTSWRTLDPDARARVTATVAYVVDNEDEEHDIHSPIGIVDDEEQVAELEAYLRSRGHGQEA